MKSAETNFKTNNKEKLSTLQRFAGGPTVARFMLTGFVKQQMNTVSDNNRSTRETVKFYQTVFSASKLF